MGRIEATLEANTSVLNDIKDALVRHFSEDDERFNEIKKDISKINGKMIFGSGFIAAITSVVTLWFKGH
jgi:uncharacterized membrane-anchored protein YhcB (DUF1043 family)